MAEREDYSNEWRSWGAPLDLRHPIPISPQEPQIKLAVVNGLINFWLDLTLKFFTRTAWHHGPTRTHLSLQMVLIFSLLCGFHFCCRKCPLRGWCSSANYTGQIPLDSVNKNGSVTEVTRLAPVLLACYVWSMYMKTLLQICSSSVCQCMGMT